MHLHDVIAKATSFARPPCIVDLYIDCQVAQYPEEADENGASCKYCFLQVSHTAPDARQDHNLKHSFSRQHLVTLTQEILPAKHSPTYQSILALDINIRDDPWNSRVGFTAPASTPEREVPTLQQSISLLGRQFCQLPIQVPETLTHDRQNSHPLDTSFILQHCGH